MRQTLSICIILLICATTYAQQKKNDSGNEKNLIKLDMYPGPENKLDWENYLLKLQVIPANESVNIPKGTYSVNVEFMVDIHGKISQARAINDPGYGLAAKAINHIQGYKGNWKTARQSGKPVNVYQRQPVKIVIS